MQLYSTAMMKLAKGRHSRFRALLSKEPFCSPDQLPPLRV